MKELKNLSEKELIERKTDVQKRLLKVYAQIASGTVPENPGNVKNMKKTLAHIIQLTTKKGGSVSKNG